MRVIAIGDIHGCSLALKAIVAAISPTDADVLVPVGDVIDRGPNSREVVELLMELRTRCRLEPILGNHEEMLLDIVNHGVAPESWFHFGGAATLESYGPAAGLSGIPDEHLQFLASFRPYWETETHFFVHANFQPNRDLGQQSAKMLRWTTLDEYTPPRHVSGKIAIVGHSAERSGEIFSLRHLKCIDTYCYGGGWLTALDVMSGQVWQADREGHLRGAATAEPSARYKD
ncbi:MAG: metallophosphoesterase [Planctomycetota bacterium]